MIKKYILSIVLLSSLNSFAEHKCAQSVFNNFPSFIKEYSKGSEADFYDVYSEDRIQLIYEHMQKISIGSVLEIKNIPEFDFQIFAQALESLLNPYYEALNIKYTYVQVEGIYETTLSPEFYINVAQYENYSISGYQLNLNNFVLKPVITLKITKVAEYPKYVY